MTKFPKCVLIVRLFFMITNVCASQVLLLCVSNNIIFNFTKNFNVLPNFTFFVYSFLVIMPKILFKFLVKAFSLCIYYKEKSILFYPIMYFLNKS